MESVYTDAEFVNVKCDRKPTNKEELKLLNSKEYQEKTAEAIFEAIFKALEEVDAIE